MEHDRQGLTAIINLTRYSILVMTGYKSVANIWINLTVYFKVRNVFLETNHEFNILGEYQSKHNKSVTLCRHFQTCYVFYSSGSCQMDSSLLRH
jgi:hypothetical protein